MARDDSADRWKARVKIDLVPVNKYGDTLQDTNTLSYSVTLEGSLSEIVSRLERLKDES